LPIVDRSSIARLPDRILRGRGSGGRAIHQRGIQHGPSALHDPSWARPLFIESTNSRASIGHRHAEVLRHMPDRHLLFCLTRPHGVLTMMASTRTLSKSSPKAIVMAWRASVRF
jgi:hypothetical protein